MRVFLLGMSGPGSLTDLRELIDPIRAHVDGVVWTLHDSHGSQEATYLESVKGAGAVVHLPFSRRHSFSRNSYLYCGSLEDGDICVQIDCLERLSSPFAANLRTFAASMIAQGITCVWYYNKPLVFQYHESLEYTGSPHESLRRHDGGMRSIELSQTYPTETDIRYSVRAARRDKPYSWVTHYARYYIDYPWGSNHCLLGNVNRGDELAIFRARETMRTEFRDEMRRRGVKLTVDAIVSYWKATPLDDLMRRFVNGEKILNDAYRYFILNDLSIIDEHEWSSLKAV